MTDHVVHVLKSRISIEVHGKSLSMMLSPMVYCMILKKGNREHVFHQEQSEQVLTVEDRTVFVSLVTRWFKKTVISVFSRFSLDVICD